MKIENKQDTSHRTTALTAAIGLLMMIAAAIFADSLRTGLIVEGDIKETLGNIANQTTKFRLSILGYVVVILLDILVAWALYLYFKQINKSISLLAGLFRVIYATLFFVAVFNLIGVLKLLENRTILDENQIQAQTMLALQSFTNQWNFSFVFFGIHLGLLGWLALRTKQMHNIFGILLLAAGLGYTCDGLGKTLMPNYSVSLIMFTFIGEVLLMIWLFFKGLKIQPTTKR